MNATAFGPGLLVEIAGTRLEFFRKVDERIYLEDCATGDIHTYEFSRLLQGLIDGTVKRVDAIVTGSGIVNRPNSPSSDTAALSGRTATEFARKIAYVMAFIEQKAERGFTEHAQTILDRIATNLRDSRPPVLATVFDWVSNYRKSGEDRRVLIDSCRGRRGLRQIPFEDLGLNPDRNEALIERALKSYLNPSTAGIADAYREYEIGCQEARRLAVGSVDQPKIRQISQRQFERRVRSQLIPFELDYFRKSKATARANFRSPRGPRPRWDPLEVLEVDDAALRLYVIDEETGLPLGPVWWTGIRCRATHAVVGFYLYFEPASTTTFLGALRHSLHPRDYLRRRFPDITGSFPVLGLGRKYVFDRAKFNLSDPMLATLKAAHVDAEGVERLTPWAKGAIEGLHGLIQRHVTSGLPGHIPQDKEIFRELNPKNYAVVSLIDLLWAIHKYVIDVLHEKPNFRGMTPNQLLAEYQRTWPPRFPPQMDKLNIVTGHRFLLTPSHKGVTTHYLEFASPALQDLIRRLPKKTKVAAVLPPGHIAVIYVWDPAKSVFLEVPNRDLDYAARLTFHQHKVLCKLVRRDRKTVTHRLLVEYRKAYIDRFKQKPARPVRDASGRKLFASSHNSNAILESANAEEVVPLPPTNESERDECDSLLVEVFPDLAGGAPLNHADWHISTPLHQS